MELCNGEGFSHELLQGHTLIRNQTLSVVGTMSLKSAVELGIADIMERYGRPVSLSELARSIPIPPEKDPMLRRLMRLLVSKGVFSAPGEDASGATYFLTSFSRLLLREGFNMSSYVLFALNPAFMKPLDIMSAWFKTEGGTTPFELANDGQDCWEFARERPELSNLFNQGMAATSLCVVKAVVTEHPDIFRGLKSVVDVGGGTGASARTIAEAFPELKCIVFDLPHVVATLSPKSEAIHAVGGDMFDSIPPANAAFLKEILHDWSDEDCVKILKRCKEAIPPREEGGKVIIVDIILNSHSDNPVITETQLFYDMHLMVISGKEREEHEWRKIFSRAGFTDYKIFPMMGVHSIIEIYP